MRFARPSLTAALIVIAVYAAVVCYSAWYLRTELELPGSSLAHLALLALTSAAANVMVQRSAPCRFGMRILLTGLIALVAAAAVFIKSSGGPQRAAVNPPKELVAIAWATLLIFTLALPAVLIPARPPNGARSIASPEPKE